MADLLMADSYKPKFLDTPTQHKRRGRKTAADVGIKPELEALIRNQTGKVNYDDKIGKLIADETKLIDRETGYRKLSKSAIRSLGIERCIPHAETLTFGCLIFMLLNQDTICLEEGGDIASLKTTPNKLTVNEIDWSNYMSKDEAKKTAKSRKKAGRSEATQQLFMDFVALYPNFMSMQDDPRYSLSRTKKLDPDTLDDAGVDLGTYNLGNYVFYATERQADEGEPQEIFLRFMKAKSIPEFVENENNGKFIGTSEDCMKTFKRWAKKLGIPQLDKFYASKRDEAAAAKKAKKTESSDDKSEGGGATEKKEPKKAKKAGKGKK